MGGANGTFEDEAPLLEGTTPHMQSSAPLHVSLHGTFYILQNDRVLSAPKLHKHELMQHSDSILANAG